ncbi:MAG: serine/threonine protein kinase [Lachnospiraceae bacterium]|nr:serine/threonine protein kinase [Lachnospiraceae bacterium]
MDTNKLPEGLLLNKTYSVGACLGEGGFGITYLGFDVNLEKKVAIKEFFLSGYCDRTAGTYEVVPKDGAKGQTFCREKARFVEEARILAKIDEHPGIVKVLTYFEENGTAYIIMEFIEGRSLKSYINERGGWLPVTETLELMEPIIKALAAVHDKGIVHRDISPDNIMLTTSGRVKLIDFGAAKSKEMDLNSNRVFKKSYSPIEQCERDGEIGTYSDIYAICATIYQIITGTKPPSALERKKEN